jgi:hypothetical protein
MFNNDGIEREYKNFDEITCLENYNSITHIVCIWNNLTQLPQLPHSLKILYCNNNKLTQLPQLHHSLEKLICYGNKLTQLPKLPHSLKTLLCTSNNLTQLPQLPHSLKELYCCYNKLTQLPTLPYSLKVLNCYNNKLKQLPQNIIYCRRLDFINYNSNPIELTTQQINFMNWVKERNRIIINNTIYNDPQNTHNSHIQQSLLKNINNLFNH